MLKLLIVDDEEIVCNTIANLIGWSELGIRLAGICMDGVEAYHRILDEEPDIVMTDIKMPGMSGVELIERIAGTDLETQFIILSGYGEFEYAKRAMKCGVRHYVLKPYDERQIIQVVEEAAKECKKLHRIHEFSRLNENLAGVQKTLVNHMISKGISCPEIDATFFEEYKPYMEVSGRSYVYCCFYYLEREYLEEAIDRISVFFREQIPGLSVHKIYISKILLLFFADFAEDYEEMDRFLAGLSFAGQNISIEYKRTMFSGLKELLLMLIEKLKRYDVLYFVTENGWIPNFNYESITSQVNQLIPRLDSHDKKEAAEAGHRLDELFQSITSREFMLQLSSQILVAMSAQSASWGMRDVVGFLTELHTEKDCSVIHRRLIEKIGELTENPGTEKRSAFIEEILRYLDEHVEDENLTLKWIAQNHLYMNVNYVSRCFVAEMNQTFSNYFMNLKVRKAKEIFNRRQGETIQSVAEMVGCGNNPYYFSKIFKKCTGMTPTMYLRRIK